MAKVYCASNIGKIYKKYRIPFFTVCGVHNMLCLRLNLHTTACKKAILVLVFECYSKIANGIKKQQMQKHKTASI